jgi:hypothetical protein
MRLNSDATSPVAFKSAKGGVLFSSDVTARGMDFPNVTTVIQVGLPASCNPMRLNSDATSPVARAVGRKNMTLVASPCLAIHKFISTIPPDEQNTHQSVPQTTVLPDSLYDLFPASLVAGSSPRT